jgi:hypothetical protein
MFAPDDNEPLSKEPSELERRVSETLTEGDMESKDPEEAARERLIHPYEYRIQADSDPIVEETIRYRQLAKEVDDRYEKYMERNNKLNNSEHENK